MRLRPSARLALAALVASVLTSCHRPAARAPAIADPGRLRGGSEGVYAVPGFDDREYIVRLPPAYDGTSPVPVVFGFHGGGGKKEGFVRTGCPAGDLGSPACLSSLADREGFALVVPDGTDAPGLGGRSWNAGGGNQEFRCVGGEACESGVDDVAYFDALLAEIRRAVAVDERRVYATGISNGGAMSHRLACERSEVVAAIGTVAGENQAGAVPGCAPSRPVPVLAIHGTADPCWGYDGSIAVDLCKDGTGGRFVSVKESMDGWLAHNGCATTSLEAMVATPVPDVVDDGTTTSHLRGQGCVADTEHLRVEGGGHTWPGGWPYFGERLVGKVSRDFDGNARLWAFFAAHPR